MRNYPVHIISLQIVHFHNLHHVVAHICYCVTEYSTTFLIKIVQAMINCKM
ncbi:Uncharacterised protein [Segatella copri]|nr:Uncharacterised protein [Segatella copri]